MTLYPLGQKTPRQGGKLPLEHRLAAGQQDERSAQTLDLAP